MSGRKLKDISLIGLISKFTVAFYIDVVKYLIAMLPAMKLIGLINWDWLTIIYVSAIPAGAVLLIIVIVKIGDRMFN